LCAVRSGGLDKDAVSAVLIGDPNPLLVIRVTPFVEADEQASYTRSDRLLEGDGDPALGIRPAILRRSGDNRHWGRRCVGERKKEDQYAILDHTKVQRVEFFPARIGQRRYFLSEEF